jgi:hypothetical protein
VYLLIDSNRVVLQSELKWFGVLGTCWIVGDSLTSLIYPLFRFAPVYNFLVYILAFCLGWVALHYPAHLAQRFSQPRSARDKVQEISRVNGATASKASRAPNEFASLLNLLSTEVMRKAFTAHLMVMHA